MSYTLTFTEDELSNLIDKFLRTGWESMDDTNLYIKLCGALPYLDEEVEIPGTRRVRT